MEFLAWLAQHGPAFVALAAAIRAFLRARTLRDSAVAEATTAVVRLLEETENRLAASEGRERGLKFRNLELEARAKEAESRAAAMKREYDSLHQLMR